MDEGIEEKPEKTTKTTKTDIDVQMIPEVVTPIFMIVLTEIFKAVISFFTWKWLKVIFTKEKEETDESSSP